MTKSTHDENDERDPESLGLNNRARFTTAEHHQRRCPPQAPRSLAYSQDCPTRATHHEQRTHTHKYKLITRPLGPAVASQHSAVATATVRRRPRLGAAVHPAGRPQRLHRASPEDADAAGSRQADRPAVSAATTAIDGAGPGAALERFLAIPSLGLVPVRPASHPQCQADSGRPASSLPRCTAGIWDCAHRPG